MVAFLIIEHWQPLSRTFWYATQGKELYILSNYYVLIYLYIFSDWAALSSLSLRSTSLPETDKKAFQWFWEEFVGVFPDLN